MGNNRGSNEDVDSSEVDDNEAIYCPKCWKQMGKIPKAPTLDEISEKYLQ